MTLETFFTSNFITQTMSKKFLKQRNVDEEKIEKVNKKKRRDVLACICRDRKKEIKKVLSQYCAKKLFYCV